MELEHGMSVGHRVSYATMDNEKTNSVISYPAFISLPLDLYRGIITRNPMKLNMKEK